MRTARRVERKPYVSEQSSEAAEKGTFTHFMLKEIYEQPRAVAQTLQERVAGGRLLAQAFGPAATKVFERVTSVHIVACGTSYHAGIVARYFIEQLCRVPCRVEIASEFRYRDPVVPANSLFVSISQSGETADTLAALRLARKAGFLSTLAICNVPESSLVRESELVLLTRAGPEIGVASTKAFTTQLAALGMLVIAIGKHHGLPPEREKTLVHRLLELPAMLEQTLALDPQVKALAKKIEPQAPRALPRPRRDVPDRDGRRAEAQGNLLHPRRGLRGRRAEARAARAGGRGHAGHRGRAEQRPAREGEVEPAGSARARRHALRVRRPGSGIEPSDGVEVITMPRHVSYFQAPAVYTVPLQLLAYHTAVLKGTDVDQPRNLAKSVTVE